MEEFALIKSRVNLNRVNLGIALISDLKVIMVQNTFQQVEFNNKGAPSTDFRLWIFMRDLMLTNGPDLNTVKPCKLDKL